MAELDHSYYQSSNSKLGKLQLTHLWFKFEREEDYEIENESIEEKRREERERER